MKQKIIGYTAWVFDVFHVGHLNILRSAKSMCDELIVAVTTDEYTFRIKGKYPIIPYEERVEIIASMRYTDRVIAQDIDSLEDFVSYMLRIQRETGFDMIFKWSDAEWTERWLRLEEELEKVGSKVVFFPYTVTTSSTLITEKLSKY
jgi:glycerol-3-phosphate cytidylyltransferase